MSEFSERLQGTDGIRGRIADDENLKGTTPLEFYLKNGFLTPAFFELYAFAFASLLIKSGNAEIGEKIVIGWDPRDTSGRFNQAAVNGIRKAGLNAVTVGVLPTPAIALYMISIGAASSMVLTASHNPSDQNGIKVFLGYTALKFLPLDDELLTRTIQQHQFLNLAEQPIRGELEDQAAQARKLFIEFCHDPENSWIKGDDFSDTILVIDAAKGAVAGVVKEIFRGYDFKEIIFSNMEGEINEQCGVSDLEGNDRISAAEVVPPDSRFHAYNALRIMFEKAAENPEVKNGKIKLTSLVFDGDCDRCFRLDYHPRTHDLLVSSGDLLGIHQARYLQRKEGATQDETWFISTVESDINTALAARDMGYKPIITGVGDKWILLKAVLDLIQACLSRELEENARIFQYLKQVESSPYASGLKISKLWKEYLNNSSPQNPAPVFRFRLGIEESGHCITPGFLPGKYGINHFFAGNGVKSGLNSLQAVQSNFLHDSGKNWFDYLCQPFEPGIKETFYVYYVDKSRLLPDSDFRKELEQTLKEQVQKIFPDDFSAEIVEFPEENSMLYCQISSQQKLCGAIFMRNSGTEDKSALYLRGEQKIASFLREIGTTLHLLLLKGLKERDNDLTKFEIKLLKAVNQGDARGVIDSHTSLPVKRIIKEAELKENLLVKEQGVLYLTELGKLFIEDW